MENLKCSTTGTGYVKCLEFSFDGCLFVSTALKADAICTENSVYIGVNDPLDNEGLEVAQIVIDFNDSDHPRECHVSVVDESDCMTAEDYLSLYDRYN